MSRRNQILLGLLAFILVSAFLSYGVGGIFRATAPEVSVRAEPVFYIGNGVGLGPGHEGDFIITNSMLLALIVTIVLTVLSIIATSRMRLVPRGFQNLVELAVDGMYNTFGSVDRRLISRFWPMVGTIFFYVLFSNWLALVPGVLSVGYRIPAAELHHTAQVEHSGTGGETVAAAGGEAGDHSSTGEATPANEPATGTTEGEAEGEEMILVPYLRSPSADLNNTLMLGLVAFFFIEYWGFKRLKIGYLSKFFPFREGPIMIFAGLLEFISEFVRIISFAFRLFGNIFAGEVILLVMLFLFPLLPLPFLGLEAFVGFIQAFVFAILVMAFASLATQAHGGHDDHGHAQPEHAERGGELRQSPAAH